ncbi:MAG: hypothetical protein BroJett011_52000 [Chloroflexota bacterium]|nr:MAG: hypothetical protein BroJett011_52000 [Chloroflexota bacterium]
MSPRNIFMSCDDIRKLIANNYHRLQKRREQEALLGISVDPSIPLEIEIIEETIRHLQVELKACEDGSIAGGSPSILSKFIDDTNLKQRVQIFLSGNLSSLPVDRQSAAIHAFAVEMGISARSIEVYRVYGIHIAEGETTGHILETKELEETPIWPIPIITGLTSGLNPISEDTIQDYAYLSEHERKDANYFGLVIVEDGMKSDGIFPKDIALIRPQPTVKLGEIAAIVIQTPKVKLGVLRRYYIVYEKRKKLAHWLLEASNPTSKHLIVMPSEVDINAIQELYAAQIQAGRVQLYADAELIIAGKYVGVVKKS